jgi:hypothetical protein
LVNALVMERHDDTDIQKLLNNCVLPVFGLDNETATYPFIDLQAVAQNSSQKIELLCKLLPAPDECMQTFQLYRDTAHVIFPGVYDVEEFESQLLEFLRARSTESLVVGQGPLSTQTVFGKDLHWVGLLFAALASGVQCSDIARRERQIRSQVFSMLFCKTHDST